ncbi:MAG: NAD-dependent epimerase/dehydratase family protein [Planctomycetaceae bacterium]|jgi:UDP-glucose 4-epimerase|nr:NAD-dependent epimerase/dehydratase family protein [Planctomycetaceae bacterium]MBT6918375.1 NAD-dependent epimerase/dehydratase family protein [Planctomycetaceae bacterium]
MKIIVTGGAGFIGSHIVDACLRAGHDIEIIDNLSTGSSENIPRDITVHRIDIRDVLAVAEIFKTFQPDAVCHQAAQLSVSRSVREPLLDADINCLGLLSVLDAAVATDCKRMVFASSGGVLYGDVTEPALETAPANPLSPYGITKWAGEKYLNFFAREHGLTSVALRYSNVFGPRQNPHGEAGVVAIFCKQFLNGHAAHINGDGKYVRDYVYGPDVAAANLAAIELSKASFASEKVVSLNIGTGIGTDVNELEEKLRTHIGLLRECAGERKILPGPEHGPERVGDLRSNLLDASLASNVLGWKPTHSLDEGLEATSHWFFEKK